MNIDQLHQDPSALAWAAGLYEGEGCASLDISGPSISVTIGMTDEEPLRLFHEIVGVGIVKGPFKRTGNRKEYWLWRVRSWDDAEVVYELFRKWLSPRRIEQFEDAFKYNHRRRTSKPSCGDCDVTAVSNADFIKHLANQDGVCKDAWVANHRHKRARERRERAN